MPDGKKMDTEVRTELDRRDLLKIGAAGLGLAALNACTPGDPAEPTWVRHPRTPSPLRRWRPSASGWWVSGSRVPVT
jgi:hypothetical protein